jgi:hypothetical protein
MTSKKDAMADPNKRYLVSFGGAMVAYTLVIFASVWLLESRPWSTLPAAALALAPTVPALFALRAFIVRVRAMDEFQRRIVSESLLWAAGIVGFASFGYGFLEGAVEVPEISFIWILPALIGTYGVMSAILFRMNR